MVSLDSFLIFSSFVEALGASGSRPNDEEASSRGTGWLVDDGPVDGTGFVEGELPLSEVVQTVDFGLQRSKMHDLSMGID
ncbi:hypothetical protein ACVWXO_002095 [Bradyrhizobium sp. LM2.7]|nr:hypothetical protein [Bradyrhizobium sp. 142]